MRNQIVIVEDENDILHIVAETLTAEGYTIRPFWNASTALTSIRQQPPALIITDLLMPGMSGGDLIRSIHAEFTPAPPILVMSASVNIGSVVGLPIQAFLSKPFDLDELCELVMNLLHSPGATAAISQSAATPRHA